MAPTVPTPRERLTCTWWRSISSKPIPFDKSDAIEVLEQAHAVHRRDDAGVLKACVEPVVHVRLGDAHVDDETGDLRADLGDVAAHVRRARRQQEGASLARRSRLAPDARRDAGIPARDRPPAPAPPRRAPGPPPPAATRSSARAGRDSAVLRAGGRGALQNGEDLVLEAVLIHRSDVGPDRAPLRIEEDLGDSASYPGREAFFQLR